MKIAILSPFEEKVPPVKYGGTELVVYNLIEQIVAMGHDVTLFGTGDSRTSAKLKAVFEESIRNLPECQDAKMREIYKYIGVGRVISSLNKEKFDIVHNHIGWRVLPYRELIKIPIITTLHGPLDASYAQKTFGTYKDANYVSISYNQRKPMTELNYISNVYNGIDIKKFKFFPKAKEYFAFLGRMSPEKGPVQAIQIAKKAGVKLMMAAKVDASDREYFEKNVKPMINGEQIKFIGEIGHEEKVELLGNARALLAPIQWEEPFGLFFVEAMICGTPVITMRRGSAPEIIVDKKTGFICDNVDEAASRTKELDKINRLDCHEHVKKNFSAEKMAENYVAAYRKILKSAG